MNTNTNIPNIPKEDFEFVGTDSYLHDKKLETKPIGYFRDAFNRFVRNKSSVAAAIIIMILVLYAIFVPMLCQTSYSRALTDTMYQQYSKLPPKMKLLAWAGVDGTSKVTINSNTYEAYRAKYVETGMNPIVKVYKANYEDPKAASENARYYDIKVDNYYNMGMMELTLTPDQYKDLQAYQNETGLQIIYPSVTTQSKDKNANIWYKVDTRGNPVLDEDGNFINDYRIASVNDKSYDSLRIASDTDPEQPYAYARVTGTSEVPSYIVRVSKYNYFIYRYGFEPSFNFGTTGNGFDIFTRLAAAARFSFLLAICVSAVNLTIGTIYGSVQGYYGGWVDMIMDRICDVLNGIPFSVVTVLFQLHLSKQVGVIGALIFAFVLTGWLSMAARVRMQFYRFKGQEYVLAARTLGASDKRVMFKHIFPNSLGTIITGVVLVIPGVIFSESSLTYLGIVNLESSTMTSVGTMLANARSFFTSYPYIIFFPCLFIALLEISFNLFGNGLRDAFNPSLRGVE